MMLMTTIALTILVIAMITMFVALTLSKKPHTEREKMSPFECGFDPKSSARLPFSLQFFMIAMIFLIFDVELTMLMPFILTMKTISMKTMMINAYVFMSILLGGLYHEWNQGSIKWTI